MGSAASTIVCPVATPPDACQHLAATRIEALMITADQMPRGDGLIETPPEERAAQQPESTTRTGSVQVEAMIAAGKLDDGAFPHILHECLLKDDLQIYVPALVAIATPAQINRPADHQKLCTPLHTAAMHSPEWVPLLLKMGADPGAVDEAGRSPLHYAVGPIDLVDVPVVVTAIRALLASGADALLMDAGHMTPIHYAVRSDVRILEAIVDAHTDVDIPGADTIAPIALAAVMWNAETTRWLLQAGATPKALHHVLCTEFQLDDAKAAMAEQRRDGCVAGTIAALVEFGDDPNTTTPGTLMTPLHKACAMDCAEAVIALLEAGARPCARNARGRTPAMMAGPGALQALKTHADRCVNMMMRDEAHPERAINWFLEPTDHLMMTPLHKACAMDCAELVTALLESGANPGAQNANGYTPAMLAGPEALQALTAHADRCMTMLLDEEEAATATCAANRAKKQKKRAAKKKRAKDEKRATGAALAPPPQSPRETAADQHTPDTPVLEEAPLEKPAPEQQPGVDDLLESLLGTCRHYGPTAAPVPAIIQEMKPVSSLRSAFEEDVWSPGDSAINDGFRILTKAPAAAVTALWARDAEAWLKTHAWGPTEDVASHVFIVRHMQVTLASYYRSM